MLRKIGTRCLPGVLLGLAASGLWAQTSLPVPSAPTTLKQAFDAAWARQPEAQSNEARREAALARRESANSWTAEPPALELSGKTDRFNENDGAREYEVGVAVPLWLPGERSHVGALAEAQLRAAESRTLAAQLRTAAAVREGYWSWQRAQIEAELAHERLKNARELAEDVAKRVRAGELARADQHQAEGALAAAESALAEAESQYAAATQQLRGLTGTAPVMGATSEPPLEPEPEIVPGAAEFGSAHPAAVELRDRSELARREMLLAAVQRRANPELWLALGRERDAFGDPWLRTATVGVRVPLGSDARHRARVAAANAEAVEAEAQLQAERERLRADIDAAQARVAAARKQLTAAKRRSQLAQESRGFFQKAFQLGEVDLPARLRAELEAAEAGRELARTRSELAGAVSALRQTLGLLPE